MQMWDANKDKRKLRYRFDTTANALRYMASDGELEKLEAPNAQPSLSYTEEDRIADLAAANKAIADASAGDEDADVDIEDLLLASVGDTTSQNPEPSRQSSRVRRRRQNVHKPVLTADDNEESVTRPEELLSASVSDTDSTKPTSRSNRSHRKSTGRAKTSKRRASKKRPQKTKRHTSIRTRKTELRHAAVASDSDAIDSRKTHTDALRRRFVSRKSRKARKNAPPKKRTSKSHSTVSKYAVLSKTNLVRTFSALLLFEICSCNVVLCRFGLIEPNVRRRKSTTTIRIQQSTIARIVERKR